GNQSNQPLALLALTPQPRFGTPPCSLGGFAVQVERGVEGAALGARTLRSGPTSTTRHRRWWIEKEPRRYRRGPVIHRGGTGSADRVLQPLPGAECGAGGRADLDLLASAGIPSRPSLALAGFKAP